MFDDIYIQSRIMLKQQHKSDTDPVAAPLFLADTTGIGVKQQNISVGN